jgi:RNA recognition motif-containing protein
LEPPLNLFIFINRAFLEMLKAPIPNASDGTQSHSLFLGNLSMFINEDDIEVLFNQYSGGTPLVGNKKMEAKIIRTEKGMSLGYGFINMRSEAEAEAAMKALNGRQFHGRPLQINWAVRNIKKTAPSTEQDLAVINSVHVKFSTLNVRQSLQYASSKPVANIYIIIINLFF